MQSRTKVLWAEKTYLPIGYDIKEIYHAYYHLFYVLEGDMTILLDRQPHKISQKTCIMIPPKMKHEINEMAHSHMTFLEIKFVVFDPYLRENLRCIEPIAPGNEFVEMALTYIINNWMIRDEQAIINMDCFMSAFLTSLLQAKLSPQIGGSQYINTSSYSKLSQKIIMYIEENYKDEFNLKRLSESLCYNANYLCSAFKKDTGITIIDYLNFARIHRALEFLTYSNIDVSSAGYRTGFNNPCHFSRTFKNLVGVSPNSYKRALPVDQNGSLDYTPSPPAAFDSQILPLEEALERLKSLGKQVKEHRRINDVHVIVIPGKDFIDNNSDDLIDNM